MAAQEGEPEAVSIMRPRLIRWLGGRGQMEDVRASCREIASMYMADPSSTDPTIAGTALRVAAIDGTSEDFDAYLKHAEETDVPADRNRYLGALGYFSDPALQDRALNLTGTLRPNEVFPLVRGVSRTDAGREKAFQWMMANYDKIAERMPPMYMAYMPFFVSGCSQERLAVAEAYFAEPEHNAPGTGKNMLKVTEQVMDCVNLREREGPAVADYLSKLALR